HAVLAAFADAAWQHAMRERLAHDGARLAALLRAHGFVTHATPLFSWSADPRAHALHDALAARGIWTRYFAHAPSVRIGLPAGDDDWRRLERTLAECVPTLAAAAAHPSESTTRD
ncbi:threonine-phosphate decarboxylase, partial [Burkholderia pseudomallei]